MTVRQIIVRGTDLRPGDFIADELMVVATKELTAHTIEVLLLGPQGILDSLFYDLERIYVVRS